MLRKELPDAKFYDAMRAGHRTNKGHKLEAHLESPDGDLWQVVRDCCAKIEAQAVDTDTFTTEFPNGTPVRFINRTMPTYGRFGEVSKQATPDDLRIAVIDSFAQVHWVYESDLDHR